MIHVRELVVALADAGGAPEVVERDRGDPALGEPAELFRAVQTSLTYPETVGDAGKIKIAMSGSAQFVRGVFLGAKTSVAANGSSAGIQQGQMTTAAYGILSVFSQSTNLNVQIQFGNAAAFANATTR